MHVCVREYIIYIYEIRLVKKFRYSKEVPKIQNLNNKSKKILKVTNIRKQIKFARNIYFRKDQYDQVNSSFLPKVTAEQKTTETADVSNYNWSSKAQNKMPEEIVTKSADGGSKQAEITRGSADNYKIFALC